MRRDIDRRGFGAMLAGLPALAVCIRFPDLLDGSGSGSSFSIGPGRAAWSFRRGTGFPPRPNRAGPPCASWAARLSMVSRASRSSAWRRSRRRGAAFGLRAGDSRRRPRSARRWRRPPSRCPWRSGGSGALASGCKVCHPGRSVQRRSCARAGGQAAPCPGRGSPGAPAPTCRPRGSGAV